MLFALLKHPAKQHHTLLYPRLAFHQLREKLLQLLHAELRQIPELAEVHPYNRNPDLIAASTQSASPPL